MNHFWKDWIPVFKVSHTHSEGSKLGMVRHWLEPECYWKTLLFSRSGSQWRLINNQTMMGGGGGGPCLLNCWSFANKLSLMVDHCKLECHVKRLDCCVQLFKVMVTAEVKKKNSSFIFFSLVFSVAPLMSSQLYVCWSIIHVLVVLLITGPVQINVFIFNSTVT